MTNEVRVTEMVRSGQIHTFTICDTCGKLLNSEDVTFSTCKRETTLPSLQYIRHYYTEEKWDTHYQYSLLNL